MVLGLDECAPTTTTGALVPCSTSLVDTIGNARPTAVNLSWAVERVRDAAVAAAPAIGDDPAALRELVLSEADHILREDRDACTRIGLFGLEALAGVTRVLTHCNTGRLATAGWGTALGVIYAKVAAGEAITVYASETRPLLQGARLTSWELHDAGIDVTLIPDGASSTAMAQGRVEAVIVGADRIAANGDTANKIGTFTHAVNAKYAGIPFYVAAPLSTFDTSITSGAEIVIEERPADEMRRWASEPTAPPDIAVWNPAFDVTPGRPDHGDHHRSRGARAAVRPIDSSCIRHRRRIMSRLETSNPRGRRRHPTPGPGTRPEERRRLHEPSLLVGRDLRHAVRPGPESRSERRVPSNRACSSEFPAPAFRSPAAPTTTARRGPTSTASSSRRRTTRSCCTRR